MLSGHTHQVLTAVTVKWKNKQLTATQTSDVTFTALDDARINAYIATDEPYDKAGGYGIQGLAGKFISHINGSYSSIMGLPLYETTELLREIGMHIK